MIPNELKNLKQWVCWQGTPTINGKMKKMPINALTGGNAQSNNPDTWCDYDTAVRESAKYSGIGFMFANGYFGVDIDDVEEEIEYHKQGEMDNIVSEFIYSLESYAEYSQSGKGIHIICKGSLPTGGRRKGNVEMYQDGRFFIMTGNVASEYTEIKDCTDAIKPLHAKYIGVNSPQGHHRHEVNLDLDENEIINLATQSKQGQAFSMLYNGAWEGLYTSQSDADMAFCNMLAFWCGRDAGKMDSIFRKSALMRKKWDERRGGKVYGEMTIQKAIAECKEVYIPHEEFTIYIEGINTHTPQLYSMDDTGNAQRFVKHYKNIVRYSFVDKAWYYYTGLKWQRDMSGEVEKLIDDILPEMKKEKDMYAEDDDMEKAFDKHIKYSRSNKGKQALKKEVQHQVAVLPSEFDRDIWQLNCQNGILNLQDGDFSPHGAYRFMSKVTNAEYSDKVDCPQWIEFLNQIFDNDAELIRYIQKAVGYSLTGSTQEQCMFVCFGNGRNGKSTFLDTISDILGDYACNIQPESLMVKSYNGSANSDIARLKGARFVTTVEPNEGNRFNEGLIKQLTGGDRITARFQYGSEFEYTPEFKIWMGSNHKPIIRGTDDGIWRRMHLIPFDVQIPEHKVDKSLKFKLKREYMAILNWCVEGALLWQMEGLSLPAKVKDAVKEYKAEMDVIASFLEECTERGVGDTKANDLYMVYKSWARENNEYEMSSKKFHSELGKRFNKHKSHGVKVYHGLKIRQEYAPYKLNLQGY